MRKLVGLAAAMMFTAAMSFQAFAGTAGALTFNCDVEAKDKVQAVLIDFSQGGTSLKEYQMYELKGTGEGITFTIDPATIAQEVGMNDIAVKEVRYGILNRDGSISYYFGKSGNIEYDLFSDGASFTLLKGNDIYPDSKYAVVVKYKDSYEVIRNYIILFGVDGVKTESQLMEGTLVEENGQSRYKNQDDTYVTNEWKLLDNKWYYFDENGNMMTNATTPDGYQVGNDGVWIQ